MKKIAFESQRDGNFEIYIMNADGSMQTRLTHAKADSFNPAWSPDGKQLAFESDHDGNFEIYIMNADGSMQTRLTKNNGVPDMDSNPIWSPNDNQIAFLCLHGWHANRNICVVNADNSGEWQITSTESVNDCPSWSPDGARISFISDRTGHYEIYVVNASGSGERLWCMN